MIGVVLLFDAPLQSWGQSALSTADRPTALMPTLSGVTGMIANALGLERFDDLPSGLAEASLWTRADRPGQRLRDFRTIGGAETRGRKSAGVRKPDGKQAKNAVISDRWYLSDAAFTAIWVPGDGLSAEDAAAALDRPARPLYLGRRSCPPASPVLLGVTDKPPEEVLRALPLLRDRPADGKPVVVRHQYPAIDGDMAWLSSESDVPPPTFDRSRRWRGYRLRQVRTVAIEHPADQCCARRGSKGRAEQVAALSGDWRAM